MEYTKEELLEAKRQIASPVHTLVEVVKSLEGTEDPDRYKSQLPLARRWVAAFTLAEGLIRDRLDRQETIPGQERDDP